MKKFVKIAALLAALIECAALASCSNSSGSPAPAAPIATTYTVSVGTFDNGTVAASKTSGVAAGETVTLTATPASWYDLKTLAVTAADSSAVATSGTGNTRTFTMPAQNVTVSATFSLHVAASGDYEKVGEVTIESTSYDIVTFGLWPQTIKADSVTVDTSITEPHGAFTYCKGSDGEWYVKQAEKAYGSDYKYSDGTAAGQGGTSEKWFKVEPIKWRVLATNYGGNKLLLAESILIGKRYDDEKNNYKDSEIRAWLNNGFLQSAFTAAQQSSILATTVDNSERSTNPAAHAAYWNFGNNQYACDNTSDKIFLLSEKEVTTSAYGFAAYDKYVGDSTGTTSSTRIRVTTDFAKATGAYQDSNAGMGGWWWLRSPYYHIGLNVLYVDYHGKADSPNFVNNDRGGIVPALCVAN